MHKFLCVLLIFFGAMASFAQDNVRKLDLVGIGTEFSVAPDGQTVVVFTNGILMSEDLADLDESVLYLQVYNVESNALSYEITDVTDYALDIAFSADGSTFASSHQNGLIHIWNTETGEKLQTLYGTNHGAYPNYVFNNGQLLLSRNSGQPSTYLLWNIESGSIQSILAHRFESRSEMEAKTDNFNYTSLAHFMHTFGALTPDETWFVSVTQSGHIWRWDLSTLHENPRLLFEGENQPSFPIRKLFIHPDGDTALFYFDARDDDNAVGLYKLALGSGGAIRINGDYDMRAMTITPDGNTVIWGNVSEQQIFIAPLDNLEAFETIDLAVADYITQPWVTYAQSSFQVSADSKTLFVGGFLNDDRESDFIYVIDLD